jgi:hypothetical protein
MDRATALRKLKEQRQPSPGGHPAASSHIANEAYMQEFETALQEMGLSSGWVRVKVFALP